MPVLKMNVYKIAYLFLYLKNIPVNNLKYP